MLDGRSWIRMNGKYAPEFDHRNPDFVKPGRICCDASLIEGHHNVEASHAPLV
jgi:hypothetical protein